MGAKRYLENREQIRKAQTAYSEKHREEAVRRATEWRKANPEKYRAAMAKHRERHREKRREVERKRRRDNPQKYYEKYLAWRLNNPEKEKAKNHRARARRRGSSGSYSESDVIALLKTQKNKCLGCERQFGKSLSYEIDHVMPLFLGGSNGPDNIQLLCRRCNRSKGAMHPSDWAAKLGKLFV